MLDQLLFLFVTALITFTLYPFWIAFVYKYHMGEAVREDGPQTHLKKRGTPTMGGLVFVFTVALLTIVLNRSRTQTLFPIFVASLAGLFGLLEDFAKVFKRSNLKDIFYETRLRRYFRAFFGAILSIVPLNRLTAFANTFGSDPRSGLNASLKLSMQFLLAGFVSYWVYFRLGWDYLWLPLAGNIHIGWLYPVFIFLLFMVVLNFVAFTDGVDGLAGGLALIAFGAYWVIAAHLEYNSLATLAATFVGALLPFLYFNIHPTRIFMGDVGSHVLGAVLTIFAIVMHREVALFFILAVFLVDGFSSPLQQFSVKLTRKRIFRMAPLHHHFELLGWPETKVMLRFWLAGIFFGLLGIFVALM